MSYWVDKNNLKAVRQPLTLSMVAEEFLTSQEKRSPLKSKEFVRMAGYPSEGEALHMVRDGNVSNVPVEAEDINYAFVLGKHVASIKGKMTNAKAKWRTSIDADLICSRRAQTSV